MYAGLNYCVACIGSLYPLCQTNLTDFSCRSEFGDAECKTNTYQTNILTTCQTQNVTILSTDSQCFSKYLITSDYVAGINTRTITVDLAQNKICAI